MLRIEELGVASVRALLAGLALVVVTDANALPPGRPGDTVTCACACYDSAKNTVFINSQGVITTTGLCSAQNGNRCSGRTSDGVSYSGTNEKCARADGKQEFTRAPTTPKRTTAQNPG